MDIKNAYIGLVVCHGSTVGTITEIQDNWITINYNYVCRVEYCEKYFCSENEEHEIINAICNEMNVKNLWAALIRFDWFVLFLKTLGYEYKGHNDKNEEHVFYNSCKGSDLHIYPTCYYPNQGDFRISNLHVTL